MKIESIEDFLNRGGKVEVLPTKVVSYKQTMRVRAKNDVMSLFEGEEIYGKKNDKLKPKVFKEIAVDISKLPKDLLEELKALGVKL